MQLYKGHILMTELSKVSGYKLGHLYKLKEFKGVIENIGKVAVIKRDKLRKFKEFGEKCTLLDGYYPFTDLARQLGLSDSAIYVRDNYRKEKFDKLKICNNNFIKLPKKFIDLVSIGYTPYAIRNTDKSIEQLCKDSLVLNGLKIGFY